MPIPFLYVGITPKGAMILFLNFFINEEHILPTVAA